MYTLALEVIMRAVFGVEELRSRDELDERVRALLEASCAGGASTGAIARWTSCSTRRSHADGGSLTSSGAWTCSPRCCSRATTGAAADR